MRYKKVQNQKKKRFKVRGAFSKLTFTQKETLDLSIDDFLTPKQIALRRGVSVRAVYKTFNILQKKGYNLTGKKRFTKKGVGLEPHAIRYHGIRLHIQILWKDQKYKKFINKIQEIDGNTIQTYRNALEIHILHSFEGKDENEATAKGIDYITKLLRIVESKLKIILIKNRSQNIKILRHHYSEVNNELAKDCEVRGDRIKIYAQEDGKLWFTIDNSFNFHEMETQHPETAKEDMILMRKHFNDIRFNNPPTNSEIMVYFAQFLKISTDIAKHQKDTTGVLLQLLTILKDFFPQTSKEPEETNKKGADYFG